MKPCLDYENAFRQSIIYKYFRDHKILKYFKFSEKFLKYSINFNFTPSIDSKTSQW